MTAGRALVGAGLLGVAAAITLASVVLVVGRESGPSGDESRVVHVRTETFIRENPFREYRDRPPEARVHDVWTLSQNGGFRAISVTRSVDGLMFRRMRIDGDVQISEQLKPRLAFTRPRQGAPLPSFGIGFEGSAIEVITDRFPRGEFRPEPGDRVGETRYVATFEAARSDIAEDAVTPAYLGDLDAQGIEMEIVVRDGLTRGRYVWALLQDGTRTLVESNVFGYFTKPASSWDEIEAAVWGD